MYKVSFHTVSPDVGWYCAAPRHEDEPGPLPKATTLRMIVLAEALQRGELVVHEAGYCCDDCRLRFEADLGVTL